MAKDNDSTHVAGQAVDMKPTGLLHALGLIEQVSVAERTSPIPVEVFTSPALLPFVTQGLKVSIIGVITTALLSPFMFSVQEGLIPVFGSYNLSLFDRAFILALTTSLSFGGSFLIFMILRKLYCGNLTKIAIHSLISGIAIGSIFGSFIVIILFHILYYRYLTPEWLVHIVSYMPEFIRPGYRTLYWVLEFCNQLIPSSYFQAAVNILSALLVVFAIISGRRRTRKINKLREKWM